MKKLIGGGLVALAIVGAPSAQAQPAFPPCNSENDGITARFSNFPGNPNDGDWYICDYAGGGWKEGLPY